MENTQIKITGIKKAISDYKNWLSIDSRHTANIMLDKSSGKVWTDIFVSCNSWKIYHDKNIISLLDFITVREEEKKPLTMQLLKKYAEIAINQ